jgi:hypothetical protein
MGITGARRRSDSESPWPQRLPELIELFEHREPDGSWLSRKAIADRMHLSKSTVSGKLDRLGLHRDGPPATIAAAAKGQPPKPPKARRYLAGESTLPPLPSLMDK